MPHYLIHANYTSNGLQGLLKEGGSGRREALTNTVESLGGSLESFYYAFGEFDAIGIAEFPDDASAAAFSLQVSAVGAFEVELTVLIPPETIDEAASRDVSYRPPGQ